MPELRSATPDFWCGMPDFWCATPDLRYGMPELWYATPDFWEVVQEVREETHGVRYDTQGIRHQRSGHPARRPGLRTCMAGLASWVRDGMQGRDRTDGIEGAERCTVGRTGLSETEIERRKRRSRAVHGAASAAVPFVSSIPVRRCEDTAPSTLPSRSCNWCWIWWMNCSRRCGDNPRNGRKDPTSGEDWRQKAAALA